jgi:predicted permease
MPAWQTSRLEIAKGLHESGPRVSVSRLRSMQLQGLVVVQVALAFILLAGAGLMINSFVRLRGQDVGLDPSGLLSFEVQLPRGQYMVGGKGQVAGVSLVDYSPAGPALFDRIHEALRTTPGVIDVAGVGTPPFSGGPGVAFRIDGAAEDARRMDQAQFIVVTENYFNTMHMRLLRGRDFASTDALGSPWVIAVNEAMARQYWPKQDPLGQHVTFEFYPNDGEPSREVIAIIADTKEFRGQDEAFPVIYALHRQQQVRQRASLESRRMAMSYVVRTTGDPLALANTMRATVARVDPVPPVTSMRTVESYLDEQVQQPRFIATLFGMFALVALVIGVVGIYSVTAHGVTQRRQEFGIRRALGAQTGSVIALVLRRSLVVVVIGAAVGLGASLLLTRFIQTFLWRVKPSDPATFVIIGLALVGAGALACLVPALRATRVDPLVVLRHE